jgi:NADPH-dependent 2,4-dienoyl-CoA reductase/sulfur reductase-like enzyme
LIIGGGPAGLAAASEFVDTEISVALVDENAELGGQYYRQRSDVVREANGEFRKQGRKLIEYVKNSNILVITSSYAFAAHDDDKILYIFNEKTNNTTQISFEYLIIATGSQELVLPYQGWETPKCITPGMASRLFDIDCVDPTQSIVIGGSGPFLLSVAAHLIKRGVDVKAVIEYYNSYKIRPSSISLIFFPTRLIEFLRYRLILLIDRVPIKSGYQIDSAKSTETGIVSKFKSIYNESELEFHSDYVAISYGFLPTFELSSILDIDIIDNGRDRITNISLNGKTSKRWIYVVGESVNIQGWRSAIVRGQLAAFDVIHTLRKSSLRRRMTWLRKIISLKYEAIFAHIRKSSFQEGKPLRFTVSEETLVCRCEGVSYKQVLQYLDQAWSTVSGLKAETRVGMGTCQGKQCGYALGRVCTQLGIKQNEGSMNVRIPLRPLPISAILQISERNSRISQK